jgi:hypothetical protein
VTLQRAECGLDLRLANFDLNTENFGFALPMGSFLEPNIDQTIVRLKEEGVIEQITNRWLQGIETMENETSLSVPIHWWTALEEERPVLKPTPGEFKGSG